MKTCAFPKLTALAALILLTANLAMAQSTEYTSGASTWSNGGSGWSSVSGGPYTSTWTSGNNAVFEGTAGTVTLSSPTAHNLTFNTTGYILSGASTLILNGSPSVVTLNVAAANIGNTTASIIAGTGGLTVNSVLGDALTIAGGQNTITGGLTVNGGALLLNWGSLATTANIVPAGNTVTIGGGGTLALQAKTGSNSAQTFAGVMFNPGANMIDINDNGTGTFSATLGPITRNPGATVTLVISGANAAANTSNAGMISSSWTAGSIITDANGVPYATFGTNISIGTPWTVAGNNWAMVNSTTAKNNLVPVTYTPISGASIAGNASVTSSQSYSSGSFTPTSMIFNTAAAETITLGSGVTLTTGGILVAPAVVGNASTITGSGTLKSAATAANDDLVIINNDSTAGGGLTIGCVIADATAGATGLTKSGAGALTLSGVNTFTGPIFNNAGTLTIGSAGQLSSGSYSANILNNGGFNYSSSASQTLSGVISGTASVTDSGAGTLTLAGANTYTSTTAVNGGGTLSVASLNYINSGTLSPNSSSCLGHPVTAAAGTIGLGSSTTAGELSYTGTGETSDRVINLAGTTGGATLDQSGTGLLKFTSAFTATGAGSKTLTLQGSTAAAGQISAAIVDNSSVYRTTVVKSGTGLWTLSGTNTYSGNTTISSGTLAIGAGGFISNTPVISIASGAILDVSAVTFTLGGSQSLSGSGTVNGSVSNSAGTQFNPGPGGSSAVGNLTITTNLVLAGGDTINYNFNATTNNVLIVGGNLTPNNTVILNVATPPPVGFVNGSYVLFQVSGTLNGGTNNFQLTGLSGSPRQSFSLAYNTGSSPNTITLQVSGNPANLVWDGGLNGNAWDVGATTNWLNGANLDYFYGGDLVSFTDAGSANPPVLTTNVTPFSVTFNSANSYTLSGNGSIAGATGLLKTNSGTLAISTTNTYTGVTYLGGGKVSVATVANGGSASPLGAGTNASANLILDGSTLQYTGASASTDHGATLNAGGGTLAVQNSATALTLNGVIAGSSGGALTLSGPGTVALAGRETYTGNTVVNGGLLQMTTNTPSSGLTAWYAFEGIGNDGTVNGNNLTLTGSPTFVPGRFGQAISLNGSSQYASTAAYPTAFQNLNNYSVSVWVNVNGAPATGRYEGIVSTRASGNDNTFDLQYNNVSGTPIVHSDIGTGTAWLTTAADFPLTLTPGLWYAITYVVNNAAQNVTIYVNGSAVTNYPFAGTPLFMKSAQVMNIGNLGFGAGTVPFNGNIDDVRLYNRALSGAEVAAIAGGALPASSTVSLAAGATLDLNGTSQTIRSLANLAGNGGLVTNSATAMSILTLNPVTNTYTFSGTIADSQNASVTNSTAVAVSGSGGGTQILNGVNAFSGGISVNSGTLTLASSVSNGVTPVVVGNSSGAPGILNLQSGVALNRNTLAVGNLAGSCGAVLQSGAAVSYGQAAGYNDLQLGAVTGGYGYYNLSGGSLTANEIGVGGAGGGNGVMDFSSGTFTNTGYLTIARGLGSLGVLNVTGGALSLTGTSPIGLLWNSSGNSLGVLNINNHGTVTANAGAGLDFNPLNSTNSAQSGIVNLGTTGTLTVDAVRNSNPGSGLSLLNFNGGTLMAGSVNDGPTFFTATLSGAYVYPGGATIDDGGSTITISQRLQSPVGYGLNTIAVANGGTNYIAPPVVSITGGSGVGATASATVSGGAVTGFVITSPGTGYANTDTLSVSVTGGGGGGASAGAVTFAANAGGALTKVDTGTLILTATNSYSGGTAIQNGTLQIATNNALPVSTTVTFGTATTSGTLELAGLDQQVAGFALGSGASWSSQTIDDNTGGAILTSTGSSTFGGVIQGSMNLTVNGGALTLTGANTYSGGTVVSNGMLALSGSGSLNTTNINVLAPGSFDVSAISGGVYSLVSGQAVSGVGTVNGTINTGYGTLLPGGNLAAGTLTVANLTLSGSAVHSFDLANNTAVGGGTNDLVIVTGNLDISQPGTPISFDFLHLNPAVGSYTLFQYGTFSGSVANLAPPANARYGFTFINNAGAHSIQVQVSGNPANLVWHGDGSFNGWDNTGSYQNWFNGVNSDYFYDGDNVTFNDIGSNTPAIYLTATLSPGLVTVSSTNTYEFGGSGTLSGLASLVKNNSGTLILDNSHYYTGGTVVNGGVLQIGNGGTSAAPGTGSISNNAALVYNLSASNNLAQPITGAGSLALNNSGDYTFNSAISQAAGVSVNNSGFSTFNQPVTVSNSVVITGTGTATFNGSLAGAGGVTMSGSGTVALTASNSYSGATIVNSGTLYPENNGAFGNSTNLTVNPGGGIYVNFNYNFGTNPLVLGGSGNGAVAALQKGGGGASTFGGSVTLTTNTVIKLDGSSTLNLTNLAGINGVNGNASLTLNGDGGSHGLINGTIALGAGSLTENGSGTWTLTATNNSWSNGTTINSGTLQIGDGGADGSWGSGPITNAGTLTFFSTNNLLLTNFVTGAGNLYQSGTGTTVLSNAPLGAFTGKVYISGNGHLQLAPGEVLTNQTSLTIGTAQADTGNLVLTGGNLVSNVPIAIFPRAFIDTLTVTTPTVNYPNIINLSGTNTISPPSQVTIPIGGNLFTLESDSGYLIFNAGVNAAGVGRYFALQGAASGEVDGPITENSGDSVNVYKFGAGTWILNGASSTTGNTIVSNGTLVVNGTISSSPVTVGGGTLSGSGTISSPVTVNPGAAIAGGTNSFTALTLSAGLTNYGNVLVAINKLYSPSNSQVLVTGVLTNLGNGSVTVSVAGPPLVLGDSFPLFNQPMLGGATLNITPPPGAGLAWSNRLAIDGTLSVVTGSAPLTGLAFIGGPVISGTTLTISATNSGAGTVYLLTSTNLAAPLSSWTPIWTNILSGSGTFTNNLTNTVNAAVKQEFYLLSTNF